MQAMPTGRRIACTSAQAIPAASTSLTSAQVIPAASTSSSSTSNSRKREISSETCLKVISEKAMMKNEGGYVLRSIAESILNLSLGLGDKMTPQKKVLCSAGLVHLRQDAMNEYVGWETVSKSASASYSAAKIVPCRFPTYCPPLRLGGRPISKAGSAARREEAAAHGVDIARYRDRVSSMGRNPNLMIALSSSRGGSYEFVEFTSGSKALRVTSKFLPELAKNLLEPGARLKAHIDLEYLVPTDLTPGNEPDYIRGHLEGIRCNVILSDMLVGRQFDLHDWKGIKSYQQLVKEELGVEAEVEMLQGSYLI